MHMYAEDVRCFRLIRFRKCPDICERSLRVQSHRARVVGRVRCRLVEVGPMRVIHCLPDLTEVERVLCALRKATAPNATPVHGGGGPWSAAFRLETRGSREHGLRRMRARWRQSASTKTITTSTGPTLRIAGLARHRPAGAEIQSEPYFSLLPPLPYLPLVLLPKDAHSNSFRMGTDCSVRCSVRSHSDGSDADVCSDRKRFLFLPPSPPVHADRPMGDTLTTLCRGSASMNSGTHTRDIRGGIGFEARVTKAKT